VPRRDPEADRHHTDDQERGDDRADAGAAVARRVQTGAPEHEQRDEHGKGEPVLRRLPQQPPQRCPPVVELAQSERAIQAQREACHVDERQREDAGDATDERPNGRQ
jgi:hypothetical protein